MPHLYTSDNILTLTITITLTLTITLTKRNRKNVVTRKSFFNRKKPEPICFGLFIFFFFFFSEACGSFCLTCLLTYLLTYISLFGGINYTNNRLLLLSFDEF